MNNANPPKPNRPNNNNMNSSKKKAVSASQKPLSPSSDAENSQSAQITATSTIIDPEKSLKPDTPTDESNEKKNIGTLSSSSESDYSSSVEKIMEKITPEARTTVQFDPSTSNTPTTASRPKNGKSSGLATTLSLLALALSGTLGYFGYEQVQKHKQALDQLKIAQQNLPVTTLTEGSQSNDSSSLSAINVADLETLLKSFQNQLGEQNEKLTALTQRIEQNEQAITVLKSETPSLSTVTQSEQGTPSAEWIQNLQALLNQQQQQITTLNQKLESLTPVASDKESVPSVDTALIQRLLEQSQKQAAEIAQLQQQLIKTAQLESATSTASTYPKSWQLSETTALIRLANIKLVSERDITTAETLLNQAYQAAQKLDTSLVEKLKPAFEADQKQLSRLKALNIDSIVKQLSLISSQLDTLSPTQNGQAHQQNSQEISSSASEWKQNLNNSWKHFMGDFITITPIDKNSQSPIVLTSDQADFLRENIRFQLTLATQAALQMNNNAYQRALDNALKWSKNYYNPEEATVKSIVANLETLRKNSVEAKIPQQMATVIAVNSLLSDNTASPSRPLSPNVGE